MLRVSVRGLGRCGNGPILCVTLRLYRERVLPARTALTHAWAIPSPPVTYSLVEGCSQAMGEGLVIDLAPPAAEEARAVLSLGLQVRRCRLLVFPSGALYRGVR